MKSENEFGNANTFLKGLLLDRLDEIDRRHGRLKGVKNNEGR